MSDLIVKFTIVDRNNRLSSDTVDLFNCLSLNREQVDVGDYIEDLYLNGDISFGRKSNLMALFNSWLALADVMVSNLTLAASDCSLVNVKLRRVRQKKETALKSKEMIKRNHSNSVLVEQEVLYVVLTVRV